MLTNKTSDRLPCKIRTILVVVDVSKHAFTLPYQRNWNFNYLLELCLAIRKKQLKDFLCLIKFGVQNNFAQNIFWSRIIFNQKKMVQNTLGWNLRKKMIKKVKVKKICVIKNFDLKSFGPWIFFVSFDPKVFLVWKYLGP